VFEAKRQRTIQRVAGPLLLQGERIEAAVIGFVNQKMGMMYLLGAFYAIQKYLRWIVVTDRRVLIVKPPFAGKGPGTIERADPRTGVQVEPLTRTMMRSTIVYRSGDGEVTTARVSSLARGDADLVQQALSTAPPAPPMPNVPPA